MEFIFWMYKKHKHREHYIRILAFLTYVLLLLCVGMFRLRDSIPGTVSNQHNAQILLPCCREKPHLHGEIMSLYLNWTPCFFVMCDIMLCFLWLFFFPDSMYCYPLFFLTIFMLVCFLQPAAFLAGVGGLVFLIHYNDERRAIPKGVFDFQMFNSICACRICRFLHFISIY